MTANKQLAKPDFGQKCNNCGYCCTESPCELANEFIKQFKGPCRELETMPDGRKLCGLVQNPVFYLFNERVASNETTRFLSTTFAGALGIGTKKAGRGLKALAYQPWEPYDF